MTKLCGTGTHSCLCWSVLLKEKSTGRRASTTPREHRARRGPGAGATRSNHQRQKIAQVARLGRCFLAHSCAAAMRLEIGGWEWNRISTRRDGWLSLKFCLSSFSMAVT